MTRASLTVTVIVTKTLLVTRNVGARPALPYSSISSISSNEVRGASGVFEVECFEWPQTVVESAIATQLETEYQRKTLKETDIEFPTDSVDISDYDIEFQKRNHIAYEYRGKKYIRFLGDKNAKGETLSDGSKVQINKPYWIAVEPIKWLVDEQKHEVVAKKILFAGVQFNHVSNYTGNFEQTDIKKYLDNCFAKALEAIQRLSKSSENININTSGLKRETRLQKLNPDTTVPSERRNMTDTEIIHNWIEAGQSVLLRGPSGIGKTERIKTLYPDLIYIKLTNNMLPEKVVGSMNFQTGQNIPPDFAKQALLSCATDAERKMVQDNIQNLYEIADTIYERSKTSTKKIVILLDELLNVKPAVQCLVYTLVLNRLVETGKGLKLPANTVIVATGNQKKYSNVAEDVAEPLEKRFDHIFDMEPHVGEWIYEYAIPNQVHPAVIGYIASKYIEKGRSEKICNMDYFYEEPEVGEKHLDRYDCHGRTNDPRGWVSISNTLYAFEKDLIAGKLIGKNVENLLQISIGTKLREGWAAEFLNFYNIPTLTVEEVVKETYTQADLPRNINERFACMISLLLADENQVGICRTFINQYCDPEYRELYDLLWIGTDENKMVKINELKELAMAYHTTQSEGVGKRR